MGIIYEGFGNVLTHKAQTITIPVNVVGVMGAGLALGARNRIHGLNESYKTQCEEAVITIGRCGLYKVPDKDKQVLLFPTKDHWKNDSKLEYVEEGLKWLVKHIEELDIRELAVPALGAGLGKLDYTKQIQPLFHQYLGSVDIPVSILLREHA